MYIPLCLMHWPKFFRKGHIDTLRPRQNGRYFPDDIFKCTFWNENVWISIKISLKFVSKCPIGNVPTLVQIMAWTSYSLVYWRICASLGLNVLIIVSVRLKSRWPIRLAQPRWINLSSAYRTQWAVWTLCKRRVEWKSDFQNELTNQKFGSKFNLV